MRTFTICTQESHIGSFAQNFFQIDLIYEAIELFCDLERKLLQDTSFLSLKPLKVKLGFILNMMKKITRWRRNCKTSCLLGLCYYYFIFRSYNQPSHNLKKRLNVI